MRTASLQYIAALCLACGLAFAPTVLVAQPERVPLTPASSQNYEPATQDPGFHTKPPHQGRRIIDQSFDGVDYLGSNCGCLPPDTNAAVGNKFVVETVNIQLRVFDKANGNLLLDEPLETLFGSLSAGDVYVVYDDTADRWYVSAFDSNPQGRFLPPPGLFLAVSKDGNPLHGFLPTYHFTDVGGFPDYPKPGFNEDAISSPITISAAVVPLRRSSRLTRRPPCRARFTISFLIQNSSSGPCRQPRCTAIRIAIGKVRTLRRKVASSGSSRRTARTRVEPASASRN